MLTPRAAARFAAAFSAFILTTTLEPAMAAEEPAHSVIKTDGAIEVRRYDAMIVAEVTVETSEGAAGNAAFQTLFGYISGGNIAKVKIEMTAPVTQTPAEGETIAMTAPVTQTPARASDGGDAWTVAFIMPAEWTLETLPEPRDPRVRLREIPERTLAAVRFAGRARPDSVAERRAALSAWIAANGYVATGPAETAFSNAPFVPGPFRRNEVLIPVAAAPAAG